MTAEQMPPQEPAPEPDNQREAAQGALPAGHEEDARSEGVAEFLDSGAEGSAAAETEAEHVESGEAAPVEEPSKKHWYVVKVQSGREETIREAIEKRVKIEGLEEFFGKIVVPVEKVTEMRNGKRVTKERKLYPGYLMCEVEFNDRILYLFRETSGVGDFVGGGLHKEPPPMAPQEVQRMLGPQERVPTIQQKPKFDRGDRVKVKDGVFSGMDGEVKELIEAKGLVKVEVTIFGRPVSIDLEYWQVEPL